MCVYYTADEEREGRHLYHESGTREHCRGKSELSPAGAPTLDRLPVLGSPVVLYYFTSWTVINIHV